jgi:hypothetical protein
MRAWRIDWAADDDGARVAATLSSPRSAGGGVGGGGGVSEPAAVVLSMDSGSRLEALAPPGSELERASVNVPGVWRF